MKTTERKTNRETIQISVIGSSNPASEFMPLAAAAERAIATRKIALKTGRPVIGVRA